MKKSKNPKNKEDPPILNKVNIDEVCEKVKKWVESEEGKKWFEESARKAKELARKYHEEEMEREMLKCPCCRRYGPLPPR